MSPLDVSWQPEVTRIRLYVWWCWTLDFERFFYKRRKKRSTRGIRLSLRQQHLELFQRPRSCEFSGKDGYHIMQNAHRRYQLNYVFGRSGTNIFELLLESGELGLKLSCQEIRSPDQPELGLEGPPMSLKGIQKRRQQVETRSYVREQLNEATTSLLLRDLKSRAISIIFPYSLSWGYAQLPQNGPFCRLWGILTGTNKGQQDLIYTTFTATALKSAQGLGVPESSAFMTNERARLLSFHIV